MVKTWFYGPPFIVLPLRGKIGFDLRQVCVENIKHTAGGTMW